MRFPQRIGEFGLVGSRGPATLLEMYREAVKNHGPQNIEEELYGHNLEIALIAYHHPELGVVHAVLKGDETERHAAWIDLEKITAEGIEDLDAIRLDSLFLDDIHKDRFCDNLFRTVKEWDQEHKATVNEETIGQYW